MTITAREVLDKGVQKIEAELKNEPEIRARLLGTLGKVHSGLGLTSDAIRFLEAAWEHDLSLERLPDTPLSESLAWAYVLAGRYADSERVHLETIDRARRDDAPRALAMATAALGNVRRIQGQYVESERLLREGAALCERSLGPENTYRLAAQVNLAATLLNLDRAAEATVIMETVSPTFDRLRGPDDPRALIVRRILGNCYWKSGRLDEAINVMEDVLEHQRRIVGPEHPIVQDTRPKPPVYRNEKMGRDMENPDDPAYHETLQAWKTETASAMLNVLILGGTTLESVPRGFPKPDDETWVQEYRELGLEIRPEVPAWRYLNWVMFKAALTSEDLVQIQKVVGRLSGVPESAVQSAEDFPGRK